MVDGNPPPPPPRSGGGDGPPGPPPPPPGGHPPPPPPRAGGGGGSGGGYGGAPSYGGAGAGTRGVCNDFARGTCKRGASCRYSHIGGPPSNAGGSSGYGSGYGGGSAGGEAGRGSKANASDDWQCDGCGNSNFQWRKACKRCGAQKSKAVKEAEQKAAAGWLHAGLHDTSNRIFVQGFDPSTTTEDDLKELFGGIGVIARVRQRFGFPDQWPHAVKIYRDADGRAKDEAVIKYDDPMAAQSAPGFYDGHELKGKKLSVSIATSREDREGGGAPRVDRGGGGGGGGGGGFAGGSLGYDDRRGGYDDRRGGNRGYDDRRGGYDDKRGGNRGYDDRRGGDRHRPY